MIFKRLLDKKVVIKNALGALSDFREFPCALYDILMLSQARGELYVARSQHML